MRCYLPYAGSSVKRIEDARLLTGSGQYLDDIRIPGTCSVAFVRSPHPRARIERIDVSDALAMPGVVGALTAADLRGVVAPLSPRLDGAGFRPTSWPALADGIVRFPGQAVAAVVAADPYVAADARERVAVTYAPEPPGEGEILFERTLGHGDVDAGLASAAVVVSETFRHARCAASPLEARGILARATPDGGLSVWASTQAPHRLRDGLATALGLERDRVRVIVPDVGGGFGLKLHVFPEDVVVSAVARLAGVPAKWVAERREDLAAAAHAREQVVEITVGASAEGRLLAIRAQVTSDAGAFHVYPLTQALEPLGTASILPGPYRLPAYACRIVARASPKPPIGAYRGVGMTMGVFVMERALDLLADRLSLDPAEIRRRNLIPREAYPFTSASGLVYDSGDYPAMLGRALRAADYESLRRDQARARREGRRMGIGISCYTEYTGFGTETFRRRGMLDVVGHEGVAVALEPEGRVCCRPSSPSQGQGHATVLAQLVADRLGVSIDRVRVAPIDTAVSPDGGGTFGSRGAVAVAGSAARAADRLRRRILAVAARLIEASPDDLVLGEGVVQVRGVAGRAVSLARIAAAEPGLVADAQVDLRGQTYSGAVHVAAVEIDPETGRVLVRKYVVVEDCGPLINPLLVEGQIQGAVAQGIGEALTEFLAYDGEGQLLTATLMDYALPVASSVPGVHVEHLETPSPLTEGGVKGMGEGGAIGSPAAIANAVADAMRDLGVPVTALPVQPPSLVTPRP